MSLKQNLLKAIDSALELAKEAPQTIEVRAAIIQLKQAHGSVSQGADYKADQKPVLKKETKEIITEDVKEIEVIKEEVVSKKKRGK